MQLSAESFAHTSVPGAEWQVHVHARVESRYFRIVILIIVGCGGEDDNK